MPSDSTTPASSGRQYLGSRSPRLMTTSKPALARAFSGVYEGCPPVESLSDSTTKFLMSSMLMDQLILGEVVRQCTRADAHELCGLCLPARQCKRLTDGVTRGPLDILMQLQ